MLLSSCQVAPGRPCGRDHEINLWRESTAIPSEYCAERKTSTENGNLEREMHSNVSTTIRKEADGMPKMHLPTKDIEVD